MPHLKSNLNSLKRLFTRGLAFLAFDHFVAVMDAVTVIRFGLSDASDVRRILADLGLVDARNDDFRGGRTFERDTLFLENFHGVGISDVEHDLIALLGYFPADARDHQALFETFGNADDHVVKERSVKTVFRLGVVFLVRSRKVSGVALHRDGDFRVVSVPFGPFTVIVFSLTSTVTPAGSVTGILPILDIFATSYQTYASTSPPWCAFLASLSVITPLEVERIAIPMPPSTCGISS